MPYSFDAIGFVHSQHVRKADTPRQPYVAKESPGTIELLPGNRFEDALADITEWSHLWVVYVFHENMSGGWKPKVTPPRSRNKRRGVFATRAPHRPNPIGLSLVKLESVSGLVLNVTGLDMLDGTPVLDLKPYLPFAEAIGDASSGWIGKDPDPGWTIVFTQGAEISLTLLESEFEISLRAEIETRLALGPAPHAYRRIQPVGDRMRLAMHSWRIFFRPDESAHAIIVDEIGSGYRDEELAKNMDAALDPHRALQATNTRA